MKSIFFAAFFLLFSSVSHAQKSESFDVKKITDLVMEKLSSTLALSADQQQATTEAVTNFLQQKWQLMPLQKSDPAAYASKFNVLNGELVARLKTIFSAKQMTNFLSLRPRNFSPDNVLSYLFF